MSKKEVRKFGTDLVLLIVVIAAFFAGISLLKSVSPTAYAVLEPPSTPSFVCSWLPNIIYLLMFVLVVVLLVYLLRRHFIGHVLHTVWTVVLYELLILSALLVAIEYVACNYLIELAVFAIAAIIAVFIFDILLTKLAKHEKKKIVFEGGIKPKNSIFDRLRKHMKKPEQPGTEELTELKQVLKDLKKLKKK